MAAAQASGPVAAETSAPTGGAAPRRGPDRPDRRPLRRLTVLYDPACRLCAFASGWLARQRQLVPLDLVPAGSAEARRRFPALDHAATAKDVTVVGDGGQVYRGDSAWVVCLWALRDHRAFSHTLTTPAGRRLARAAVLSAAKYREASGRTGPAGPPRSPATARTYIAPGWTYDRVRGWTQAPGPAVPPGPPRPQGPPAQGGPGAPVTPGAPGWTYDGDGHWSRTDAGACADGCATDPG